MLVYVAFALNLLWTCFCLLGVYHVFFMIRKFIKNILDKKASTKPPAPVSMKDSSKEKEATDLKVPSQETIPVTAADSRTVQMECALKSLNDSTKQILTKLDVLAEQLESNAIRNKVKEVIVPKESNKYQTKASQIHQEDRQLNRTAQLSPSEKSPEQRLPYHDDNGQLLLLQNVINRVLNKEAQMGNSVPVSEEVDSIINYSCQEQTSGNPYYNISPYAFETDKPPLRFTTELQDSMVYEETLRGMASFASESGSDSVSVSQQDLMRRMSSEQLTPMDNAKFSPERIKVQISPNKSNLKISPENSRIYVQYSPDKSMASKRRFSP